MKSVRPSLANASSKAPIGITGFDEITGGGLPRARTALLVGGPGFGKTLFALQFLMHGIRDCKEPGIFLLGCNEIQGFLFSKAVAADIFESRFLAPLALDDKQA
jgi:replicative DNA helicase